MKHRVWKAGLLMAALMVAIGSTVYAAAGTTAPAKEQSSAAATSAPAATAPATTGTAPATTAAPAATTPAAPEHTELFWPEAWKVLHNPAPWFSMGLDERFRIEAGENWDTLNDESSTHQWWYERYRTRWWTKSVLSDDVSVNTRLTWEFRTYDEPHAQPIAATDEFEKYDRNMVWDEALFDWFNVNIKNIGGMPLTATVGRQDIMEGVGWLVMDGTPLDGSRTVYFEAARFTYDWADTSNKIDLIYVSQAAESDRWLEPICDKDRAVTEQDENGAILYLTNTALKPTQLEAFFIYRNDNPIDEQTTLTNIAPFWGTKAEIFTFGGAISGTPAEHWKYRAEAALQTGTQYDRSHTPPFAIGDEHDIDAYGALTNLEYLFKDTHENSVHVGYEYASGDDPESDDVEQFNLLWGEWPRWSELLIYTWTDETEVANTTNLHRANIGHRINLNKQWTLSTDYHALWADEPGQPWKTGANGINVSDDHKFRGSLVTAWLRYKFNPQLYGHFLAEYFMPGAYYVDPSGDDATFFRFNLEYVF
ncbi:MAG: alginate export family protein [Solirubrobacterales bacterium]